MIVLGIPKPLQVGVVQLPQEVVHNPMQKFFQKSIRFQHSLYRNADNMAYHFGHYYLGENLK